MCRGNHGDPIFLHDEDRKMFLATLVEAWQMMGWDIHAYVLMNNHYHLLLETPEPNLVAGMKWFQGAYTQRFNALHQTRGHLFQGRYKAIPVQIGDGDLQYFRTVSSYIHLNPFRAKLCGMGFERNLESYVWSSYPAYIGACDRPKWLSCSRVYRMHGLPAKAADAIKGYQAILGKRMRGTGNPAELAKEEEVLKQIRRGWYLGDERLRDHLVDQLGESAEGDNLRGEVKRLHNEQGAESLLGKVLEILQLSEEDLLGLKPTALVKQATAWVLHKNTRMTIKWISERLKMGHRSNASRNVHAFENNDSDEATSLRNKLHVLTG
jgi:REP element-mobilizing transposase RayT